MQMPWRWQVFPLICVIVGGKRWYVLKQFLLVYFSNDMRTTTTDTHVVIAAPRIHHTQCKTGLMHSWTQQVEQQQLGGLTRYSLLPTLWAILKLWIVFFSISHQHHLFYETKPSRFPVGFLTRRRCSRLIRTDHFQHATQRDVSNDVFSRMEICGLFLFRRRKKGKPDSLLLAFPHWPFSVPVQKKQKGFGEKGSLFSSQSITNFKNLWRKTIEGFDLILSCFWGWIGQIWCVDSPRNTYMVVGSLLVTCIIGFIFVGYQERRLTWWKVTFTENQGCFVV